MGARTFLHIVAIQLSLLGAARAGDPKNAAAFRVEPSRWTLGAGGTVRSVDADFHFAKPAPLHWQSYLGTRRATGAGDVGLYRGGPNAVNYSDGSVGPDYGAVYGGPNPNGDAVGLIQSSSQLSATGRVDSFDVPIFDLAFHSSGTTFGYTSKAHLHGLDAGDSDVGVGPYLSLAYEIKSRPGASFQVMAGWSFVRTNHGTGPTALGWQTITERRTDSHYTYHYDYDGVGGAVQPGATFPFNANDPAEGFIIYDPAAYDANGNGSGYLPPRQSTHSSSRSRPFATLVPVARASLDVTLNEIVLAASCERALTQRLRLALALGPTINVIHSDFDATISWYANGGATPVATVREEDSSTDVKVGLMGQLSLRYDLTTHLYLEARGGYRWVDSVRVGGPAASVEVNPSSWEGGLGLGIRL